MRPRDRELASGLEHQLHYFDQEKHSLPGARNPISFITLLEQILESIHRVRYVEVMRTRRLSERSKDPNDSLFDPLKAAIIHQENGHIDEAFWLVFLYVHFGKHRVAGWRYVREVYGRLGDLSYWDWANTSASPSTFREWLHIHQPELKRTGEPHGFGNHRKYESLDAYSTLGTGSVIESYINWVGPSKTHQSLIEQAHLNADGDPRKAFDFLYQSMESVIRFGRTARFDYLSMVGKLSLATIVPGSPYLRSATGPLRGARLLFAGNTKADIRVEELENLVKELDAELNVGMQVLEDALCNWQKSPNVFKRFRG